MITVDQLSTVFVEVADTLGSPPSTPLTSCTP